MTHIITTLLSFTVLIPIIIGLVRMHRIRASYHPFLVFLLMAFTAEAVGFISIRLLHNNNISTNIYILLEAVIVSYMFYVWGFFKQHKFLFFILLSIYSLVWFTENIIYGRLDEEVSSWFILLYSLITVLLCINEINSLVAARGSLFKNSRFLICTGLTIICIYSVITEGTLLIDPDNGPLMVRIFTFYVYVNVFVNIIYAFAVYFIPVRDDYYFSKRFNA